jgi:AraC family transcriptional regulator of adaptative response / DNA-3-methyladenine glycosylase II
MAPSRLRKDAAPDALPDALEFELAYRPPYAFDALLEFLRARAIDGVEVVTAHAYRRTLSIEHRGAIHTGTIEIRRSRRKSALAVSVSASFARVVPHVLSRVKHAFDLGCDPTQVAACLGDLAAANPGLRVPGTFDGFELAARAVIGQQITVRAARTLLGRLVRELGTPIDRASDGTAFLFPTARRVAASEPAQIARLGMPSSRARTLVTLAGAIARNEIDLGPGGDVEAAITKLQSIAGVGTWTAHYIAMRALRWPDAFLANDRIVLKAMNETRPSRALARSEAWRPWRAYAVMHLWKGIS